MSFEEKILKFGVSCAASSFLFFSKEILPVILLKNKNVPCIYK